jgi:hypothetical protein
MPPSFCIPFYACKCPYFCLYLYRISLTIVDTPGFGDNIDNEKW